jgi:capsular exopolysaccharide synthesis family protein
MANNALPPFHELDAEFEPTAPAAQHGLASLRDVAAALKRRWWVPLATALLVGVAAVLVLQREVRLYKAAALIRLTDERRTLTGTLGDPTLQFNERAASWFQSELLVLRGRGVVGEVVDREGLRLVSATRDFSRARIDSVRIDIPNESSDSIFLTFETNEFQARRGDMVARAGYGTAVTLGDLRFTIAERPTVPFARVKITSRDAAIGAVIAGLSPVQRTGTDAVDVTFTYPDRRLAPRVLNTIIQVFQEVNAEEAQQAAIRRRRFLEEQLAQNEGALAAAESALIRLRAQREFVSSEQRMTAEQTALLQLEARREQTAADVALLRTMLAKVHAATGDERVNLMHAVVSAEALASNPSIPQLHDRFTQARMQRDDLLLTYTDRHAEVTRVTELIATAERQLINAIETQIATIEARVAAMDDLRLRTAERLQGLPAAHAQEAHLLERMERAKTVGDELRAEYQRVRMTEEAEAGYVRIVSLASGATAGGTRRLYKLAAALLIGMLIGGGLALLLELTNTSIRRENELEAVLRVPGLAIIPNARIDTPRWPRRLLTARSASGNGHAALAEAHANGHEKFPYLVTRSTQSAGNEAYRTLRTSLLYSQTFGEVKTLVVTSALRGDGKSTVAANLATSFAEQGVKVLLIDADLRRPRLAAVFRQRSAPGLTELLHGRVAPLDVIQGTGVAGLDLLVAGAPQENPTELVGGKNMGVLLEWLGLRYDLIVLDVPPVLGPADSTVLAAQADGVLFVVRAGRTGRDVAQHGMLHLARVGARVIGAVLNDPDAVASTYDAYSRYAYAGES